MPTKLPNTENVKTLLQLTDQYNAAARNEMEGLMLDIQDVIDDMSVEERYSANVRLLARARNIVPEIVDLEIELLLLDRDVEPTVEEKLAWAVKASGPNPS